MLVRLHLHCHLLRLRVKVSVNTSDIRIMQYLWTLLECRFSQEDYRANIRLRLILEFE